MLELGDAIRLTHYGKPTDGGSSRLAMILFEKFG